MAKIEILEKKIVYDFQKIRFQVEEVRLRHQRLDGSWSPIMTRVNLDRGDGAAAIIYNRQQKTVLLIEQFRYATAEAGDGWVCELPAGIINPNEAPEATMRRELLEETGYYIAQLEHISTFFLSPGGTSERIFLYGGEFSAEDKQAAGGGLAQENEDIRILILPLAEALAQIQTGQIVDAKTIIGLQWLQLKWLTS